MIGKEERESIPITFISKFPKITSIMIPLYKLRLRLREVTGLRDSSMFHIAPAQYCKFLEVRGQVAKRFAFDGRQCSH